MAGALMPGGGFLQGGQFAAALFIGVGTSGCKGAAARWIDEARQAEKYPKVAVARIQG